MSGIDVSSVDQLEQELAAVQAQAAAVQARLAEAKQKESLVLNKRLSQLLISAISCITKHLSSQNGRNENDHLFEIPEPIILEIVSILKKLDTTKNITFRDAYDWLIENYEKYSRMRFFSITGCIKKIIEKKEAQKKREREDECNGEQNIKKMCVEK